jgi:hypothetical protein
MFGPRGNGRKIEKHYWWLGILSVIGGIAAYAFSAALNITNPGNPASWFIPTVSALMVLAGLQLISAWGLARVLAELSVRDGHAARDMGFDGTASAVVDSNSTSVPVV